MSADLGRRTEASGGLQYSFEDVQRWKSFAWSAYDDGAINLKNATAIYGFADKVEQRLDALELRKGEDK